jgi:hypothetical protein
MNNKLRISLSLPCSLNNIVRIKEEYDLPLILTEEKLKILLIKYLAFLFTSSIFILYVKAYVLQYFGYKVACIYMKQ